MAVYVSPHAGTRAVPTDNYNFMRGTTANLKVTFLSNGEPVNVDTSTVPVLRIFQPAFIQNDIGITTPMIAEVQGSLVAGQLFEYEFSWPIPTNIVPSDQYVASYNAFIGGMFLEYGSELITIAAGPGMVNIKTSSFATVDDVRAHKFNIDDYFPKEYKTNAHLTTRNRLIESHLRVATEKLYEELNLTQSRQTSVGYRLFCIYYTIWSIMLASRGEDGSSTSDQNLAFYRREFEQILAQEKRQGILQGVPLGRG